MPEATEQVTDTQEGLTNATPGSGTGTGNGTVLGINPYFESQTEEVVEAVGEGVAQEPAAGAPEPGAEEVTQAGEAPNGNATGEEDVDLSTPEAREIWAKLNKAHEKRETALKAQYDQLQADLQLQRAEREAEKAETQPQAENPQSSPNPYQVDFSGFTPDVEFGDDSYLADEGFRGDLDKYVQARIQNAVDHIALQGQQQQAQAAQAEKLSRVSTWEDQAKSHPDFAAKMPELQALAAQYGTIAKSDPDAFIAILEGRTGIKVGEESSPQTPTAIPRTGSPSSNGASPPAQRLATKASSAVSRPTGTVPGTRKFNSISEGVAAALNGVG